MSTLMAESSLIHQHPQLDSEAVFDNEPFELIPTRFAHGRVQVDNTGVDYTIEFPEDLIYGGIAIIEPGFGGFKRTSRPLRHAMAQRGIATVSYEPVRNDSYGNWERLTNSQDAHARTIEAVATDLPINPIVKRIAPDKRSFDIDRKLLVPHSMGGLAAARYAETHGGQVDSIVNLSSAGYGAPNLWQITHNLPRAIYETLVSDVAPSLKSVEIGFHVLDIARITRYYLRNPARTIGEMAACLTNDVRPTIAKIGEAGVKTAFIAFENDRLIPPNESVRESVNVYQVMPGARHTAPQSQAGEVAQLVIRAERELHAA